MLPFSGHLVDTIIAMDNEDVHFIRKYLRGPKKKRSIALNISNCDLPLGSKAFPHDLVITHTASQTSFNIHKSIINRSILKSNRRQSPSDRLTIFIRSSTLPADTIRHYVDYLHFKALPNDCALLVTVAWISKAVFGEEDAFIFEALQDQITALADTKACELLISTWMNFQLDESSLIVSFLVARVQNCQPNFKAAFDLSMTSSTSSDMVKRMPRMSALLMLVCGASQTPQLPQAIEVDTDNFEPIELNSTSEFLRIYSTNFVIELSPSVSIGVCGWLLYIHWPWFKSLVDSGLEESKTRIITLPQDSFTNRTLPIVINALHRWKLGHWLPRSPQRKGARFHP